MVLMSCGVVVWCGVVVLSYGGLRFLLFSVLCWCYNVVSLRFVGYDRSSRISGMGMLGWLIWYGIFIMLRCSDIWCGGCVRY